MSATSELLDWLRDFLDDRLTVEQLQWRMEKFIKESHSRTLTEKQRQKVRNFFTWCVDMYDPKIPPRRGILGHLQDAWAQVIHGEYRVSLQEVRKKAKELKKLLEEDRATVPGAEGTEKPEKPKNRDGSNFHWWEQEKSGTVLISEESKENRPRFIYYCI